MASLGTLQSRLAYGDVVLPPPLEIRQPAAPPPAVVGKGRKPARGGVGHAERRPDDGRTVGPSLREQILWDARSAALAKAAEEDRAVAADWLAARAQGEKAARGGGAGADVAARDGRRDQGRARAGEGAPVPVARGPAEMAGGEAAVAVAALAQLAAAQQDVARCGCGPRQGLAAGHGCREGLGTGLLVACFAWVYKA